MKALESWLNSEPSDIDEWLVDGLKAGCEYFSMPTGIVSRVEGENYIIRAVYSTLGDIFVPGMRYELKSTYCDAVMRSHKTVTYIHVGSIASMLLHPVYTSVQLESYIGAPLPGKGGAILGTVNFSSHDIRQWEFDDQEIRTIEQMAEKIAPFIREH
jgi:hypothetical protein